MHQQLDSHHQFFDIHNRISHSSHLRFFISMEAAYNANSVRLIMFLTKGFQFTDSYIARQLCAVSLAYQRK